MANVLNRQTKEYKHFVNTPDYMNGEWIINPDMSQVEGVDSRLWKIVGDQPVPLTGAELASAVEQISLENSQIASKTRILENIEVCREIMAEYSAYNEAHGISDPGVLASLAQKLMQVQLAMGTGSKTLVLGAIDAVVPDQNISDQTLAYFRAQVDSRMR